MLLNLVIPGAGLVALRREWLGLSVAVWFSVALNSAVLGMWVLPSEMPMWFVLGGGTLAMVAHFLSQMWFVRQANLILSPQLEEDLTELCDRCRAAIDDQDFRTANRLLDMARRLNDEHPEAAVLRSKLLDIQGNRR